MATKNTKEEVAAEGAEVEVVEVTKGTLMAVVPEATKEATKATLAVEAPTEEGLEEEVLEAMAVAVVVAVAAAFREQAPTRGTEAGVEVEGYHILMRLSNLETILAETSLRKAFVRGQTADLHIATTKNSA